MKPHKLQLLGLSLLLALVIFSPEHVEAVKSVECGVGDSMYNMSNPNICAKVDGQPYCIDVSPYGQDAIFECRECNPAHGHCDCPTNMFCMKNRADGRQGSCVYYDADIIGRQCISFADENGIVQENTLKAELRYGVNDKLFCGRAFFYKDGTYRGADWVGHCQAGRCQVCSDYAPEVSAPKYPHASCGDRICVAGQWSAGKALNFSWSYLSYNPMIGCTFVMLICVVLYILYSCVILWIKAAAESKRAQRFSGHADADVEDRYIKADADDFSEQRRPLIRTPVR